jgi:hypothetical protein
VIKQCRDLQKGSKNSIYQLHRSESRVWGLGFGVEGTKKSIHQFHTAFTRFKGQYAGSRAQDFGLSPEYEKPGVDLFISGSFVFQG